MMKAEFKKEWIKQEYSNPFNWTGSKHRYLKDLFDVLPSGNNLKVLDPFVGGGDLISKLPVDWQVSAGDNMKQLIHLHTGFKFDMINANAIKKIIEKYDLSKTNKKGYDLLKADYNKSKQAILLYMLLCHSNSNRIRFSDKTGFNVQFGDRYFNPSLVKKFDNYKAALAERKVIFKIKNFKDWDFSEHDLLLIDPPYTNTTATYNERGGWTVNDEIDLYQKTDEAADSGVKFVLFGQTYSKGAQNKLLEDWASKYNVRELRNTSTHCSSNRHDDKTVEIMVWN